MLFFFEAAFLVLALAALAVGELWGRGPALIGWAVVTALAWLAAPLVRARLADQPAEDELEVRWRRMLADNWRHFNLLLLFGLAALALWWWLSRGLLGGV